MDRLAWYAPILSQFAVVLAVIGISYIHFKVADEHREKYGPLAYRYYFYHSMIPGRRLGSFLKLLFSVG